jgi:hypothetical protein
MKRSVVIVAAVIWCAALLGCNRTPSAAPRPATVTAFGYTFVFDPGEDHAFSIEGHRKSTRAGDGTESDLDEDLTITYVGKTLKIVNGKLSADGKDHGAVKPGDRITLTPSGGVSVNGAQR